MSDMPDRIWAWQNYRKFWTAFKYPFHLGYEEYVRVSWLKERIEEAQENLREPNELQSAELIRQGLVSAFETVLRLIESEEQA